MHRHTVDEHARTDVGMPGSRDPGMPGSRVGPWIEGVGYPDIAATLRKRGFGRGSPGPREGVQDPVLRYHFWGNRGRFILDPGYGNDHREGYPKRGSPPKPTFAQKCKSAKVVRGI